MARRALTAVLLGLALACPPPAGAGGPEQAPVLYLVRHAEKAVAPGGDPPLTQAGVRRAKRIAAGLADRGIETIWSTDYRRTRQTAQPAARRHGLEVQVYDPGAQEAFAERLVADGRNALVVGHSNTIPALAALLCGCEVATIHDTEYGRLLVVTLAQDGPRLEEFRQRDFFRAPARH